MLPCGSFVPHGIPGDFLKVRIDECVDEIKEYDSYFVVDRRNIYVSK